MPQIGIVISAAVVSMPVQAIAAGESPDIFSWLERFAGWGMVAFVVYWFLTRAERVQKEMVESLHALKDSIHEESAARTLALKEDRRDAVDRHCVLLKLSEKIDAAVAARQTHEGR